MINTIRVDSQHKISTQFHGGSRQCSTNNKDFSRKRLSCSSSGSGFPNKTWKSISRNQPLLYFNAKFHTFPFNLVSGDKKNNLYSWMSKKHGLCLSEILQNTLTLFAHYYNKKRSLSQKEINKVLFPKGKWKSLFSDNYLP